MRDLKDKIIAITGGATGIGFALAKAFGAEGAKIVIGETREEKLREAIDILTGLDIDADKTQLDVTDIKSVENFASFNFEGFEKIIDSFGGIEICVEKTQKEGYSFELQKGCQTVSGSTSLNWVVSRNTEVLVGEKIIDENGEDASVWEKMSGVSDLTRIERQQYVVLQMLKELDNFDNINEFTNFIEAIEETFIIDENLSIRKAIDLLWNLRDIDLDNIQKHTLPTYPYELEDGRQVLIMKESFKEFALTKGILDF